MSVSAKHKPTKRLGEIRPFLEKRGRLLQALRAFFYGENFIEVETPVRIPAPALEEYIDAEESGTQFLRTSPELHMKRMLCSGYTKIFQVGQCFRKGEQSWKHLPEFCMLEWYEAGADYETILATTIRLFRKMASALHGQPRCEFSGSTIRFDLAWQQLTVHEAFEQYTDTTPEKALEEDLFEVLLVDKIEPNLGQDRPCVLKDYPTKLGALARKKPGNPNVCERWELYVKGVELANAYSELTDAQEQEKRFRECADFRHENGRPAYPLDQPFLNALKEGMAEAGGIAVGLDRLVMILAGAESIHDVVAFSSLEEEL